MLSSYFHVAFSLSLWWDTHFAVIVFPLVCVQILEVYFQVIERHQMILLVQALAANALATNAFRKPITAPVWLKILGSAMSIVDAFFPSFVFICVDTLLIGYAFQSLPFLLGKLGVDITISIVEHGLGLAPASAVCVTAVLTSIAIGVAYLKTK